MEFYNDAGDDPLKPTLFELVAQEQLRDLLQPALKYVLSVSGRRAVTGVMGYSRRLGLCPIISAVPASDSQ